MFLFSRGWVWCGGQGAGLAISKLRVRLAASALSGGRLQAEAGNKLLELDLRISQGSVFTVLRRRGQNYKHTKQVFSRRCVPNLIKIS